MCSYTSLRYYVKQTEGKVEGNITIDLNSYYTTTMTKTSVVDLNNTLSHSYFGEGNLKDSTITESLMCSVLNANNTNEKGKLDQCFHDGKINGEKTEYISMKASRRSKIGNSFNTVMSSTPLKLYQFFNMTSGKIEICPVTTTAQMHLASRDHSRSPEYLKFLLDDENYCEKIVQLYDYNPNDNDVYSVATSYPGTDGLVYVEKTSPISAQRMFVAAVTIKAMALYMSEERINSSVTRAIFGPPTTTIGIILLDPDQEAAKFAILRQSISADVMTFNDISILEKIKQFITDLKNAK